MARPAEVFARRVSNKERGWLRSLRRRGAEFASVVTVRRAQVVAMSRRGYTASEIGDALEATADWVRRVIHEFNELGLEALLPAWGGGRPREITDDMRAAIVEVVKTHPQELNEPYACWSLSTLRAYLLKKRIVPKISKERLREILIEEDYTTQATKGWKTSPDPEFATKAARLRRLYRAAERGCLDGVLLCFDEHGPVTPTPKPGDEAGSHDAARAESEPTTASPTGWRSSSVSMTSVAITSSAAGSFARVPTTSSPC